MDWVHTALQNGFLTVEAHLFLGACKNVGFYPRDIEAYLKGEWCFPSSIRSKGKNLHNVFNEFRAHACANADKLKASAAEMLGLYGLLRHWAATEIGDRPDVAVARESFEAACAVVDVLIQTKRGLLDLKLAAPRALEAHVQFMCAHKRAHGDSHIIPKHHWMFDICEQMRKLEVLVDAFIIERLHLRVKLMIQHVYELNVMETSTLAGICQAMWQECERTLGDGLRGRVVYHDGCRVADKCSVGSLNFAAGDFVFRSGDLGLAKIFLEDEDNVFAVVQGCVHRSAVSKYASEWSLLHDDLELWPVNHLQKDPPNN